MFKARYRYNLLFYSIFILCCCIGESDKLIKDKLKIILEDDLKSVVNELPDSSVAESTYYNIVLYKEYDEGKYIRMANVEFYIFKNIKVFMVRKYRYHSQQKKWERYVNEYRFIGGLK